MLVFRRRKLGVAADGGTTSSGRIEVVVAGGCERSVLMPESRQLLTGLILCTSHSSEGIAVHCITEEMLMQSNWFVVQLEVCTRGVCQGADRTNAYPVDRDDALTMPGHWFVRLYLVIIPRVTWHDSPGECACTCACRKLWSRDASRVLGRESCFGCEDVTDAHADVTIVKVASTRDLAWGIQLARTCT
jgi:hypothetical protein